MKNASTMKVWSIAVGCIAVLIASGFQSLRAEIVYDVILAEGYLLEIEYRAGTGGNVRLSCSRF